MSLESDVLRARKHADGLLEVAATLNKMCDTVEAHPDMGHAIMAAIKQIMDKTNYSSATTSKTTDSVSGNSAVAQSKPIPNSFSAATRLGDFAGQMPSALRASGSSSMSSSNPMAAKRNGHGASALAGSSRPQSQKADKELYIHGNKIYVILDRGWVGRPITVAYRNFLEGAPGSRVAMAFKSSWTGAQVSSAVVNKIIEKGIFDFRAPEGLPESEREPTFEWARIENGSHKLVLNGRHDKFDAFELKADYTKREAYVVVAEGSQNDPSHAPKRFDVQEESETEDDSDVVMVAHTYESREPQCTFCKAKWPKDSIVSHEMRCCKNPTWATRPNKPVAYKGREPAVKIEEEQGAGTDSD